MIPTVETERLILRPIAFQDMEGIYQLDTDPEIHKYLIHQSLSSKKQALERIEFIQAQYRRHGVGRWAMIEKTSGCFTGWAGIKFIDKELNKHIHFYDVGYRLLKAYWGKGYATEATKASLTFAFSKLGAETVYGHAHHENLASRNVLEKAGLIYKETFQFEGIPHLWFEINKP